MKTIKYTLICLVAFLLWNGIVMAQSDTTKKVDETFPSFRIKTEILQLVGLKPNIYVEYKFRKGIGIELGLLYNFTGVTWAAPYFILSTQHQYRWVEYWNLKGYSADFGVKFYKKPTKFISIKCRYDWLNFGGSIRTSERNQDQQSEIMTREDLHLQLIMGFEKKKKTHFYGEFYFGAGLLFIEERHAILEDNIVNGYYLGKKYVKSSNSYVTPTFHIGYNLGYKSIPKKYRKNKSVN